MPEFQPYIKVFQTTAPTEPLPWQSAFAIELTSVPTSRLSHDNLIDQTIQAVSAMADLINSLYQSSFPCTMAIRSLVFPNSGSISSGKIAIAFIGKVSAETSQKAEEQSLELERQTMMQFGGIFPNYHWKTITDPNWFQSFWTPFQWETAHFLEIRRRDHRVRLDTVVAKRSVGFNIQSMAQTNETNEEVYFVHPFIPRTITFERFFERPFYIRHPWHLLLSYRLPSFMKKKKQRCFRKLPGVRVSILQTHHPFNGSMSIERHFCARAFKNNCCVFRMHPLPCKSIWPAQSQFRFPWEKAPE